MSTTVKVVGRCVDCEAEVTFDSTGFVPWVDTNGSAHCPVADERHRQTGQDWHRLPTRLAEQVYDEYLAETGQRTGHDVRRG